MSREKHRTALNASSRPLESSIPSGTANGNLRVAEPTRARLSDPEKRQAKPRVRAF